MPSVPLLRPDWPAPAHVHACFTLRGTAPEHGASAPPYQRFNLGDHVGDAPAAVHANRARLGQALAARPVFLNQVHGVQVLELDPATPDGCSADAALTTRAGLACTVMVADCLPVLLTDRCGRVVAAAHAGWRGLAGGVLDLTVQRMCQRGGVGSDAVAIETEASDLLAWLGPCIGPRAFEVGADVFEAFVGVDGRAAACFRPLMGGKHLADLAGLARQRLAALGVGAVYGNDGSPPWCTVEQTASCFSYRRDQGRLGATGRMAACIWRV